MEKRVLVVDDDQVVGQSFERVLTGKGYKVDTALSGREAFEKNAGADFDMVFMDLKMPGPDGLEVAQADQGDEPVAPDRRRDRVRVPGAGGEGARRSASPSSSTSRSRRRPSRRSPRASPSAPPAPAAHDGGRPGEARERRPQRRHCSSRRRSSASPTSWRSRSSAPGWRPATACAPSPGSSDVGGAAHGEKTMKMRAIPLLAAALLLLGAAAAVAAGPDWSPCLDCHDDAGLELITTAGEKLPLAVTAAELSGSAHSGVKCEGCHPGINLDSHPEGNPGGERRGLPRRPPRKACLACHPEGKLQGQGAPRRRRRRTTRS